MPDPAGQLQPLAPSSFAWPAARVPPRPSDPGPLAGVRLADERATGSGQDRRCRARGGRRRPRHLVQRRNGPSTSATWRLRPTEAALARQPPRWSRQPARSCVAARRPRDVPAIVTADQRLAEANAKTTIALFGPSGVGKTSLLWTLLAERDALRRPRGRHEVVQDWPGDSIPIRSLARCRRHRLPDRRRGSVGRPERVLLGRPLSACR